MLFFCVWPNMKFLWKNQLSEFSGFCEICLWWWILSGREMGNRRGLQQHKGCTRSHWIQGEHWTSWKCFKVNKVSLIPDNLDQWSDLTTRLLQVRWLWASARQDCVKWRGSLEGPERQALRHFQQEGFSVQERSIGKTVLFPLSSLAIRQRQLTSSGKGIPVVCNDLMIYKSFIL